jgi:hypothetical protein
MYQCNLLKVFLFRVTGAFFLFLVLDRVDLDVDLEVDLEVDLDEGEDAEDDALPGVVTGSTLLGFNFCTIDKRHVTSRIVVNK